MCAEKKILHVYDVVIPGKMVRIKLLGAPPAGARHDHEHVEQHGEVERPDAYSATRVKIAEVVLAAFGVDQNPSDQESREHKEQIQPDPSRTPQSPEPN